MKFSTLAKNGAGVGIIGWSPLCVIVSSVLTFARLCSRSEESLFSDFGNPPLNQEGVLAGKTLKPLLQDLSRRFHHLHLACIT
jgi:hypothetical protein